MPEGIGKILTRVLMSFCCYNFCKCVVIHTQKKGGWLGENLILAMTIGGVVTGVVLGIILKAVENSRGSRISDDWVTVIKFPGELLMRMLKCLIVPLITASLIAGKNVRKQKANVFDMLHA